MRAPRQEIGEHGACRDDLLQVIEYEQNMAVTDCGRDDVEVRFSTALAQYADYFADFGVRCPSLCG